MAKKIMKVPVGIPVLDDKFSGIYVGHVTFLTGTSGEGREVAVGAALNNYYRLEEHVLAVFSESDGHAALRAREVGYDLEKAVEIGIDRLSFLNCQFSERRVVKVPRIMKIVISAVKQSHKAWAPEVNEITAFDKFIAKPCSARKYIAHCYEEIPRTYLFDELRKPSDIQDAVVLVGPEGDFSIDEVRKAVAAGYQSVHLGKSRLRTETAGLSAVMMMQLAK